ncbi:DNA primase [Sphingorhabdus sp. SMR4y]|uniref:DNA primase n=1 Tax=Sphingorhabdus sp. SMR4y TaxID=2584094 RepID=UPI000B5CE610|nr:DNA primase [Sphingorhabdus sp. SMR4y]ASK87807.1 DNA primase [Sphingorhabdus sp. SMR4y]
MALSPQWLDELRARITLSSLIGRTVKIQKAGREYKACCPFHNEKTPSFTINDEKGFYHCFGCGAHGDAISWMTEQRGLGFMDAVKDLAAEAQMEVPAPDPRAAQRQEVRATLHNVMAAAQDWFVERFNSAEGAAARDYLKNRGISEKTIREFGFGFAPNSRGQLKDALSQHGVDQLIEAGLLIKVDDREPYDRFRGRLMIPIRDPRGRVIAFGGRILGDGEPKYLNSPDTPLFDKGRTLYNLDKASPASRQTGRILVVEGYMDAIALAQAGFAEVVAPLGTALTEHQIERIWKMVEKPIICFDGDAAGQKASIRAALRALPLLRPAHSLQFATLPFGQDPDDFVKNKGKAAFEEILSKCETLDSRIWRNELARIGPEPGPDARAELLSRLQNTAKSIADVQIGKEYDRTFRDAFYERFGLKRQYFEKLKAAVNDVYDHPLEGRHKALHRAVMLGLMRYPTVLKTKFEEIGKLPLEDEFQKTWSSSLLDIALHNSDLTEDMVEQLLLDADVSPIAKRDFQKDLGYSFYKHHDDPTKPIRDLELVIDAINYDYEAKSELALSISKLEASMNQDIEEVHLSKVNDNHVSKLRENDEASRRLREILDLAATGT